MSDLNNCSFTGRLTRDAMMKNLESGHDLLVMSIAVNGFKKDDTMFLDCKVWGKTAVAIEKYMLKGKLVAVTGSLQQNRWTKDGKVEVRFELNCRDVVMLSAGSADFNAYEAKEGDIPF